MKVLGVKSDKRCKVFNCDKRRGSYCCYYCERILSCVNRCENVPSKCGLVRE
ncbi:hypothetical protein [Anaerotignum sp.]|uniref:hypothetical protein n=1 Tax=Anaerotignum sp. TaxID=2039241 RepID=UPI0028B15467|nr:hypothetical protein [Anaerotignum sp.]